MVVGGGYIDYKYVYFLFQQALADQLATVEGRLREATQAASAVAMKDRDEMKKERNLAVARYNEAVEEVERLQKDNVSLVISRWCAFMIIIVFQDQYQGRLDSYTENVHKLQEENKKLNKEKVRL